MALLLALEAPLWPITTISGGITPSASPSVWVGTVPAHVAIFATLEAALGSPLLLRVRALPTHVPILSTVEATPLGSVITGGLWAIPTHVAFLATLEAASTPTATSS